MSADCAQSWKPEPFNDELLELVSRLPDSIFSRSALPIKPHISRQYAKPARYRQALLLAAAALLLCR